MKSNRDRTGQFGLKAEVIAQISGVFARYPEVESAILYGSRAKGNYRPGSDIDLTLTGATLTYDHLARISLEIDDLLLPYLFDLSLLRHIDNPDLLDRINRVGTPFYERSAYQQQSEIV